MAVNDDGSITSRLTPNPLLAPTPLPHINPVYGDDINQDAAFSGTPTIMYQENLGTAGGEYDATNVVGTSFIFNSTDQNHTPSGQYSINAAGTSNGDTMQLDNGACSTCSAMTGWIFLRSWSASASNSIKVFSWDTVGDVQAGNAVSLESYIDTGELGQWQKYAIPFDDFGITGAETDAWRWRTEHTGGAPNAPNYYLDDIQLEESGGGLEFSTIFAQPPNSIYYADTLKISTVYSGNPHEQDPRDYYNIVDGLLNGLTNVIQSGGVITSSVTFHDILSNAKLGESQWVPYTYNDTTGIGWADIFVRFVAPVVLDSRLGDYSKIIINDDLTSILQHHIYIGGEFKIIGS